ncbi:MAG: 30S ribosomal protein S12 methylthiotransferase RimO [Anaerolineales bacterium]|jgi:ribosomal protein S12 methylthiotransferase
MTPREITRFYLASLGCAKNTVDSQSMAELLGRAGFLFEEEPDNADLLIVNTCGFIKPAKEESLEALRELAANKRPGQMLIAAGCLTQRYGAEVARQVPGIDGLLGTRRWMDIVNLVRELRSTPHPKPPYSLPSGAASEADLAGVIRAAVQGASAYLKIADGCRRPCAFCAIPLIKGPAVSRPPELVLEEARQLQQQGVRELVLIAQDTSDYGHDLGMRDGLATLLEDMVQVVPGVDWIRVLYAFPGRVSKRLIQVMASEPQILPYLDMPLQHAHPAVLRRMKRPANIDWVHCTIDSMRKAMPDLALRSTFIVGYPGETEEAFQTLLDFVAQVRFDRVGAFEFSFEPGTPSEPLGDPIPADVKRERRGRLMELQQAISLEKGNRFLGQTLQVLIEGHGDGLSLGRSYRDAPEIDGLVIVEGEIAIGEMVPVLITGALPYDLTGIPVDDGSSAKGG